MAHPRPLTASRLATAAAFFTQALVFITMTTRLPVAQERWHLGVTGLSLVLLGMVLLSGVGSVAAERLAHSAGSAATLRLGLLLAVLAVPVVVLAPGLALGALGLAAYGLSLGVVDASTNMQAVALEHRYARPILPSLHGAWTLGAVLGALAAIGTGGLPEWVPALAALVPLVVAAAPYLPRDRGPGLDPFTVAVPWRPILLVGAAMALFYMVDVAAQTWGATYAHDVFGTGRGTAALGVFAYLVASGTVRLAGDRLVASYGVAPVLRVGAVLGALGLGLVVLAPTWPLALLGFAAAGAGLAVVAPLSFSAAARIAGGEEGDHDARMRRVDTVIARFNLFNYAGALLGAVMTGLVGGADIRWGFALPAVLVLAIWPLARHFVPERAQTGISAQ